MATAVHYLDPTADGKADWDETPAGTAWSCLDDGVRYPTAPNLTDFVSTSTIDEDCRVGMGTYTLQAGETVDGIRAYAYVDVPADRTMRWSASHPLATGLSFTDTIAAGTTGWVSFDVIAPFTQTQVDNLELTFDLPTAGSGGTGKVYACYIELHTRDDGWPEAMAAILANREPNKGLSVGAGFLGGDCFSPVEISSSVTALMLRDSYIATAANQKQALLTSPNNASGGSTGFVRSAIGILSSVGHDVEAATFTVATGAGNTSYFPNTADGRIRWPQGAFVRNGRLFVVGMLETSNINPTGRWVSYCDDYGDNPTDPTLWTWTHAATYPAALTKVAVGAQGIFDNSATDGFVYLFDDGTLFTSRKPTSIYRLPVAQFDDATDWTGGEWWTGTGWSTDKPGFMTTLPPAIIGRKKPRGGTYDFALAADEGVNEGTIHRRSDNKWQLTGLFDAPWTWDPVVQLGTRPYHVGCAVTAGTTIGSKFQDYVNYYELSDLEDWAYFGAAIPWLTWTGQGANDQAWSYNGNQSDNNAFSIAYYPKLCKAVSVA